MEARHVHTHEASWDGLYDADDATVEAALAAADPTTLRIALLQLVDEPRIASLPPERPSEAGADRISPPRITSEEDAQTIREIAFDLICRYRDGVEPFPDPPTPGRFQELLETLFGHEIAADELRFWWEEFGVLKLPRAVSLHGVSTDHLAAFKVLVVGAGMNGIAAAIYLKAAGVDVTVVDKNPGVGGTWFNNVYPGARVDVASRAYSYTFEPAYPWEHHYATQPELLSYFNHCVDKYGVRDNLVLGTEVLGARWVDETQTWTVDMLSGGTHTTISVNALISAVGLFNQPIMPHSRASHRSRAACFIPLNGTAMPTFRVSALQWSGRDQAAYRSSAH